MDLMGANPTNKLEIIFTAKQKHLLPVTQSHQAEEKIHEMGSNGFEESFRDKRQII